MTRKVLILGSAGTLGQALMSEFDLPDTEVVGWDRGDGDITKLAILKKIVNLQPEIIINATGYNAVDKAQIDAREQKICFAINTDAPKRLAQTAKSLGAIFINFSSDYVFHGDRLGGYSEADWPAPLSVYGKSKLAGERGVKSVRGKFYIIRLARLFGKAGPNSASKKSFVDIMLEKKNDSEIKLVDDEDGSPTYAPDLAYFTRQLIEREMPFGIYHGANSGHCTWLEWAREIFRLVGSSPRLVAVRGADFPRPAPRPRFSALINNKMPLQRSWQEALEAYL